MRVSQIRVRRALGDSTRTGMMMVMKRTSITVMEARMLIESQGVGATIRRVWTFSMSRVCRCASCLCRMTELEA